MAATRTFRPEHYKRLGRAILEFGLTTLYVFVSVTVELEAPSYMVPFAAAAIQLFILLTFFQYGVGYMNPITTLAVYIIGLTGGARGRPQPDGKPDPVHAHRVSLRDALYFIVAQLAGTTFAMLVMWIVYDGVGGHYGYEPLDDDPVAIVRNIVKFMIVGAMTMLPKLLAARKRHTVGTNAPMLVAAAYAIAIYAGWRSLLPWIAQALLTLMAGAGWDALTVIIGHLASAILCILVVANLPRRRKSVRSLESH
jgi:hypothetical protein